MGDSDGRGTFNISLRQSNSISNPDFKVIRIVKGEIMCVLFRPVRSRSVSLDISMQVPSVQLTGLRHFCGHTASRLPTPIRLALRRRLLRSSSPGTPCLKWCFGSLSSRENSATPARLSLFSSEGQWTFRSNGMKSRQSTFGSEPATCFGCCGIAAHHKANQSIDCVCQRAFVASTLFVLSDGVDVLQGLAELSFRCCRPLEGEGLKQPLPGCGFCCHGLASLPIGSAFREEVYRR